MRFNSDLALGMQGRKVDIHEQSRWNGLERVVNNGIEFGGPGNLQNIKGAWVTVTTPTVPNTDFSVTHNLGTVPTGTHLMQKDQACDVYTGSVPATESTSTLRATAAGVNIVLFIHMLLMAVMLNPGDVKTPEECKATGGIPTVYGDTLQECTWIGKPFVPKDCVQKTEPDGSTTVECQCPECGHDDPPAMATPTDDDRPKT